MYLYRNFSFVPQIESYLKKIKSSYPNKRLAIVLDIDDTIIYSGTQKPVQPMKKIYELAIRLGISVFIITARMKNPNNSKFTQHQLKLNGFGRFKQLYMMPTEFARQGLVGSFKTQARNQVSKTHHIILNVGDQWTDLDSKPSKNIENQFYIIPTSDKISIKLPSFY